MKDISILIAGVGGQGTLLASRVLGCYAARMGLDCKLSEEHGMSQRGGSVVTHARMGEKIFSPVISEGGADVLLAFEKLEALRWAHFLKPDGVLIVNLQEIMPLPVITGAMKYPDDAIEQLRCSYGKVFVCDALKTATECGSAKAVNTVMLGKMAKVTGMDIDVLKEALRDAVPERIFELNAKALLLAYGD